MTSWQDITFTVVGLVFMTTLLPTVFNKRSAVPRVTSVLTALGLLVVAATDWTIHLHFSAVQTVGTSSCWLSIAWRRPVKKWDMDAWVEESNIPVFAEEF